MSGKKNSTINLQTLIQLIKSKKSDEINQVGHIKIDLLSKDIESIQKLKKAETAISLRDNQALNKLAEQLAHNYLHISQRSESKFTRKMIGEILKDDKNFDNHNRKRNILIIGAGATYDSYQNIPLANKAIEMLKKEIGFENKVEKDKDYRSNFIDEASKIYKGYTLEELIEKLDFENWLEVLSKIHSKKRVKEFIQKLYNFRYLPSLTYEIIAHLFKHRFIDVIINFNFDELLEQAIEEELGKGNYFSIISDGDCLEIEELMTDNRLKIPIYIKPHGTVSHKSTLRFTKDSYLNVPEAIQEMISNLVSGKVAKEYKKSKINNINLITIGFGLQSVEFNKILRDSISNKKNNINYEFYFFDLKKPNTDRGDDDDDVINKTTSHLISIGKGKDDKGKDHIFSVDERFVELWEYIKNKFEDLYQPRNIVRHNLIFTLFERDKYEYEEIKKKSEEILQTQLEYFRDGTYYLDRLIVEIVLELAKGKGNIDLHKLLTGRIGIYYNLYLKKSKRTTISITEICKNPNYLGLIEIKSYTNNIFSIEDSLMNKFIENIFKLLKKDFMSEKFKRKLTKDGIEKKVTDSLEVLYTSFTADIRPRFEDKRHFIFSSFKRENVLHTNLSLTATCNEILTSYNEWDTILVISERGKLINTWLKNKEFKNHIEKSEKKIFLITTDLASEDLKIDEKNLVKKIVHKLPYYAHNNHMVMFLKKNKYGVDPRYANTECGNFRFVRTNYFLKEGLENNINPIVFDTKNEFEKDQRILLRIFCSYYLKSKKFSVIDKKDGSQSVLHIPNNLYVENEVKDILTLIDDKNKIS